MFVSLLKIKYNCQYRLNTLRIPQSTIHEHVCFSFPDCYAIWYVWLRLYEEHFIIYTRWLRVRNVPGSIPVKDRVIRY